MKTNVLLPHSLRACLVAVLPAAAGAAIDASAWSHRLDVAVPAAGLTRLELDPAVLDTAAADLHDVRLVDDTGREVPWLAVLPVRIPPAFRSSASVDTTLQPGATVVTIRTGTEAPLVAVTLATAEKTFIKASTVEVSTDGENWETIRRGYPLYRQPAAVGLRVPLGHRAVSHVRITLDDTRTPPVAVTGASLETAVGPPPAEIEMPVRSVRREEFADETVFVVDLGARHVPLGTLTFATTEPLFQRTVTVQTRELQDGQSAETPLARGVIFRVEGTEQLSVPLHIAAPQREIVVHVANGDSPPLAIDSLRVQRRSVALLFNATAAGAYRLHFGNPLAAHPRYDLIDLATRLQRAATNPASASAPAANPAYRPGAALADVPLAGAPLDPAPWKFRKPVTLAGGEIHELELDLDVLAHAREDLGDLRLVRDGAQVPYLVERTRLTRRAELTPALAGDPKRPAVSRWELKLPRARLPLRRLVLTSPTALFQRQLRVYERITDDRGRTYDNTLAHATWDRRPEDAATLAIALSGTVVTDTLIVETDNGDNPPIVLAAAYVTYPVTRLLFKATAGPPLDLYYGNPAAGAPRYDLALVASRLIGAGRVPATSGPEEGGAAGWAARALTGMNGGPVFWGALVVVVVALLFAVTKLLPKPPAASG